MVKKTERRSDVVIRFAGDSGDGMQLTGDRFTSATASFGNDLSTLPDFPAEIRAPAGTLPGVSAFQIHFADHDIMTPGDAPDVLVAMNPAALKANLHDLVRGGTVIVNTDEFSKRAIQKVGYESDPLTDGSLDGFTVHPIPLTSLTVGALADFDVTKKEAERAKNMFALGLLSWLYSRPVDQTRAFLTEKFGRKPEILAANLAALEAGWSFGETTEAFAVQYEVGKAALPAGDYRNITGNLALSYGLVAAAQRSGLGSWQSYITSVEEIEEVTGFNFFTEVDPSTAIYLKNLVDTGTAPNNPTVITTFNPTLGAPGTSVTVSGYNFDAQSSVQFNGVEAASVAYVSPNQLTAVVPAGATTGPLTVDGPGGFDTSYEDFTVTTGPATPTISVSPSSLSGLTAMEGSPGTAQIYAVNGTSLTSSVTVTAPAAPMARSGSPSAEPDPRRRANCISATAMSTRATITTMSTRNTRSRWAHWWWLRCHSLAKMRLQNSYPPASRMSPT